MGDVHSAVNGLPLVEKFDFPLAVFPQVVQSLQEPGSVLLDTQRNDQDLSFSFSSPPLAGCQTAEGKSSSQQSPGLGEGEISSYCRQELS